LEYGIVRLWELIMLDLNGQFRQISPRPDAWVDRIWVTGLVGAVLVLMLCQLGELPLQDGPEASIAIASRDWLAALHIGSQAGQTSFQFPAFTYWITALSYAIGGVNETFSRLPNALLTASSIPLIYGVARELFAGPMMAVATAVIYSTSLAVVAMGRSGTADSPLVMALLILLLCLLRSRRDIRWSLGIGLATLGLVMMGGLASLVWPVLGMTFLAWDTPRLLRNPYLWWGMGLGLLPFGLWFGWMEYPVDVLFIPQFTPIPELSLLMALKTGLTIGFPWILFLPIALQTIWKNRTFSWARFLMGWLGGWSGLIILGLTNFSTLIPALALTIGLYLSQYWLPTWPMGQTDDVMVLSGIYYPDRADTVSDRTWAWGWAVAAVSLGCGLGWTLGGGLMWLAAGLGLMTMSCGAVMALCLQRRRSEAMSVLAWGTYMTLLVLVNSPQSIGMIMNPSVPPVQSVVQMISKRVPLNQTIYTDGKRRSSLDYYSNRSVVPANMTQLKQHLTEDSTPFLLMELENVNQLIKRLPRSTVKFLSQVRVTFEGRSTIWALITRQPTPVKTTITLIPKTVETSILNLFESPIE
jgi:4-amino-4-deoxy-L-arabinose transferase-like glycosyltransferase